MSEGKFRDSGVCAFYKMYYYALTVMSSESQAKAAIRYNLVSSTPEQGEDMYGLVQRFVDENIRGATVRTRNDMTTPIILTGDRISCCDEIVAAVNDANNELAGICALSAEGESRNGQAGIVATAVKPSYQKQGIGMELLKRAVDRLVERIGRNETKGPIHVDCVSLEGAKLVQRLLREKPDLQAVLEVHDMSHWLKDLGQ